MPSMARIQIDLPSWSPAFKKLALRKHVGNCGLTTVPPTEIFARSIVLPMLQVSLRSMDQRQPVSCLRVCSAVRISFKIHSIC